MNLSPVVLFVYNRPEHTRETLEALALNHHATDTVLHVYSDGPGSAEDVEQVKAVRSYVKNVSGFKDVCLYCAAENLGLASSIIDGVTQIVSDHGRVIVLEDDLVTSPWFLSYMNQALEYYADMDTVMHVNGYMYPICSEGLPDTFFCRHVSSWGWGTWSRAWKKFQPSAEEISCSYNGEMKSFLNIDDAYDFWNHLEKNLSGEINTWAILWYASVLLNGGLSLHPSISLVKNIGIDGTGVHCGRTSKYNVTLRQRPVINFCDVIEENQLALDRVKYFLHRSEPFGVRFKQALRRFLSPFLT